MAAPLRFGVRSLVNVSVTKKIYSQTHLAHIFTLHLQNVTTTSSFSTKNSNEIENGRLNSVEIAKKTNDEIQEQIQVKDVKIKTETETYSSFNLNNERIGHMMQVYEDFVGLTDVKEAQDKVVEAESQFLKVQDDRRVLQEEMAIIHAKVRAIGAELEKTHRTEPRYIDLVKKEHDVLLIETQMSKNIKFLEKEERDHFSSLSAAVRESHEKERGRAERTKYWSIIGSVIGAVIGIVGSTVNNQRRMTQLKAIITESGENTAEYKALTEKLLQGLGDSQSASIPAMINTMSTPLKNTVTDSNENNNNDNSNEKVSHDEVLQHLQKLLTKSELLQVATTDMIDLQKKEIMQSMEHHSEKVSNSLREIQGLVGAQQASLGEGSVGGSVVYVGPEIQGMLKDSEDKLQNKMMENNMILTGAISGVLGGTALVVMYMLGGR